MSIHSRISGPAFLVLAAIVLHPATRPSAAQEFAGARVKAHSAYLASDQLEGRFPGTRGADLAAEYIARSFSETGLRPPDSYPDYLQHVPMHDRIQRPAAEVIEAAFKPHVPGR